MKHGWTRPWPALHTVISYPTHVQQAPSSLGTQPHLPMLEMQSGIGDRVISTSSSTLSTLLLLPLLTQLWFWYISMSDISQTENTPQYACPRKWNMMLALPFYASLWSRREEQGYDGFDENEVKRDRLDDGAYCWLFRKRKGRDIKYTLSAKRLS